MKIRAREAADWPAVWMLLEPVFRAGETFPHDPAITETEERVSWVDQTLAVMVAIDAEGALVGTYYLKPDSLSLGAHVANAGYGVAEHCRQQGIGSRLCRHSLETARRLGFRAMQSTWWRAPTPRASAAGSATGFRSSAPCRRRSATGGSGMSMRW